MTYEVRLVHGQSGFKVRIQFHPIMTRYHTLTNAGYVLVAVC
jgi:hypothetical protein